MPDTPTVTPEPPKAKVTRGIVNKQHVEALDKAGLVVAAAKKAAYAAKLSESEIDAGFTGLLETDIAVCSARIGKAGDLTSDVRVATKAESDARNALLSALKGVQGAAKQKYARTTPQQTKDYFVGEDIDSSRARTLQVADSVLEKLKTDTLPGIKADKIASLKTWRDAYANANSTQGGTQSDASKERNSIEDAVRSITDRRIQVQFAADVQWPASDKANAPIRREFQLPVERPFSG